MTMDNYTPTYLNGNGKFQASYDNLFAMLVTVGKADTVDGRALQILDTLYRERRNGNGWSNLDMECEELRRYLFNNNFDIQFCLFTSNASDKYLDEMVDAFVKHVRKKFNVEVVITTYDNSDEDWVKAVRSFGIQCILVNKGESDMAVYVLSTYKMTKEQANEVSFLLKNEQGETNEQVGNDA